MSHKSELLKKYKCAQEVGIKTTQAHAANFFTFSFFFGGCFSLQDNGTGVDPWDSLSRSGATAKMWPLKTLNVPKCSHEKSDYYISFFSGLSRPTRIN